MKHAERAIETALRGAPPKDDITNVTSEQVCIAARLWSGFQS